jgi:hypothetical protein
VGHAGRIGESRSSYRKEKVHVEDLGVEGTIKHVWGKVELQIGFGGENRRKESAWKTCP